MSLSIQRVGLFAVVAALALPASMSIDPNVYLSSVKFLASNEMRGRATGSPELEKAAEFLAAQYKQFGLQPVAGSFFQSFPVPGDTVWVKVLRGGQPVEADVLLTIRP